MLSTFCLRMLIVEPLTIYYLKWVSTEIGAISNHSIEFLQRSLYPISMEIHQCFRVVLYLLGP
jgi:hypothetical protein